MLFEIAFILVAIGTFSTLWAIAELFLLDKFLSDKPNPSRTDFDRKPFDK